MQFIVVLMCSTPSLSRAAQAKLYSAGFPPILDRNGTAADVVDPADVPKCDENTENRDRLKVNEIVLQFMAFSRSFAAVTYTLMNICHSGKLIVIPPDCVSVLKYCDTATTVVQQLMEKLSQLSFYRLVPFPFSALILLVG